MGIGDWGLGIGDWGLGPIPTPQSPIPQSPIPNPQYPNLNLKKINKIKLIHLINSFSQNRILIKKLCLIKKK